jgi:SAM-dependent methyltransferase
VDEVDDNRQRWNARYATASAPGAPAAFLIEWLPRLPIGKILDFACGTGANALALAERAADSQARVTGIDISPVALKIGAMAAREHSLPIDFLAADLRSFPLPPAYFDAVCVFRYLDRGLAPVLFETLRPGGWLIYQTFTVDQLQFDRGPRSPAYLLRPGELRQLFAGWSVLHYDEGIRVTTDGPAALASLVARHP